MTDSAIEMRELTKTFAKNKAVDAMSLDIQPNTITGIVGRNGAGKTTLLKILAGYLRETSGDVHVFSERPFNSLNVSASSLFVDDQMAFPDAFTLRGLLEEGKRFYPNWDMDFAQKLMTYFDLSEQHKHSQLSKGKQTTFNIIFGLASRCPLTMLDEPTTGMDAAARKDFYRLLLKDYLAYPRTMLVSSHYLDELEHILENVLLIDEGEKMLHMSIDELQEYAVRLRGPAGLLGQWLYDKTVLDQQQLTPETMEVVVKRDFTVDKAEQLGLSVAPVTPSDVCIYLTVKSQGGIDDVFK